MYRRCSSIGVITLAFAFCCCAATAAQEWTLEATVTAALSQHPLVEAARARIDAARAERATAAALPNPVGTLWLENTAFPISTLRPLPESLNRELATYVTLPLEPLIQRTPKIRRADEEITAAEAALALARRRVAADAAHAFFRVALAQALVDEAEENWANLDQLAAYNRARVDEGVTAEAELLRLQVELNRAATQIAFAGVELTRRRAELAPYLGDVYRPATPLSTVQVTVPDAAPADPSAIPSFEAALARARETRPEVLAGRARVAAAAATIDYERSLSVRQMGATFGSKHVDGRNSMIAGVTIAVPLFNRNRAGVNRATSDRLAAERDLAWTERTLAADVQGAQESATQLSRELRDLEQSLVTRAEEVQRLTMGAYQEGGATLLQVLDSMRVLADAHLIEARALFAQRESLFDLALASGVEPEQAGGVR